MPSICICICTYLFFNKITIIENCVQGSFQLSVLILCLSIAVTIFLSYIFFFWVWHSTRFLGEKHGDALALQKGAFVSGVLFERTTRRAGGAINFVNSPPMGRCSLSLSLLFRSFTNPVTWFLQNAAFLA